MRPEQSFLSMEERSPVAKLASISLWSSFAIVVRLWRWSLGRGFRVKSLKAKILEAWVLVSILPTAVGFLYGGLTILGLGI